MNPEQLLDEVAAAIKHRCISYSLRWNLIYYHERITCVSTNVNVPPEIILAEFSEQMVQHGFSTNQWNHLKTKLIEFYKELHK